MSYRITLGSGCFGVFLLLLSMDPLRCSVPVAQSATREVPAGVMIVEGKTVQGYPYFYGGVSSNEREIMEEWGKSYNLKLTFAEKSGPYLANVRLVITGAKGTEIINATITGPWFYIHLPPETYALTATFKGTTKEIKALRVAKDKTVFQTLIWDLGEPSENPSGPGSTR